MSRSRYLALAVLIVLAGGVLRTIWLRADPPTTSVGIVWHDEGAWVHNARNRALFGAWRTDDWNPVFIAPVFTALEYGAFEVFGVGTWQARTVPVASGLLALAALMAGLCAVRRPSATSATSATSSGAAPDYRVAVIGGVLLATNYTWVMWNRAALMESTMTMFMVVAWAAYAQAGRRSLWGLVAGVAAALAFFTKGAAAFFAAALVMDAAWTILTRRWALLTSRLGVSQPSAEDERGAMLALAGLLATAAIVAFTFAGPNWQEYQFYNWQMTVLRKPTYDLASLIRNASWLPVVQDFFTRMWPILLLASLSSVAMMARWRNVRPAERLLVLWILVGFLELTIHDSGNERRYVMFVPALIALAALFLGDRSADRASARTAPDGISRILAVLMVLVLGYIVFGSGVRLFFLDQIEANVYRSTVRISTGLAVVAAVLTFLTWRRLGPALVGARMSIVFAVGLVAASAGKDLIDYGRWSAGRGYLNYAASVSLQELLPAETLVHGKLANGMSLENRIRPVFVGRGFGNYYDRLNREDARYILTYSLPKTGYESQPGLMQEILDRYPHRKTIATFNVDETPERDQVILVEKNPGGVPRLAGSHRAPD